MTPPNRITQLLNGSPPGGQSPGAPAPCEPGSTQPRATIRPALPTSPFGNVPVSAANGELEFDIDRIRQCAKDIEAIANDPVRPALASLNGKPVEIEAGTFTTFCAHLAHAYVQATEYANVDLRGKEKMLRETAENLRKTADILAEAEKNSTLKSR